MDRRETMQEVGSAARRRGNLWPVALVFLSGLALAWLSFGDVVGRGLYADDFVFGWLSETHSFSEAVRYWREVTPAGGRLFIAVLTPLVYGPFCEPDLLQSNLGGLHGLLVAVHLANTVLLGLLLRRYRVRPLGYGIGMLLFLLHPAKNRAVFWPAAAYGYGIPLLLFLAGWLLLHQGSNGRPAMVAAGGGLWMAAALSIEQFIVVEVGLLLYWSIQRWVAARQLKVAAPTLVLGMVLSAAFLFAHFGTGSATSHRLQLYDQKQTAATQETTSPSKVAGYLLETAKILLWRLNPSGSHSPYGQPWRTGIERLEEMPAVGLALVAASVLCLVMLVVVEIRTGRGTGEGGGGGGAPAIEGVVVAVGALIPFLLLGLGSGPQRGMLLVMVGCAVIVAAIVDRLLTAARERLPGRVAMAPIGVLLALGIAFCFSATVVNIGYQQTFRTNWSTKRDVISRLQERDIGAGDLVVVEGLPRGPLLAQLFEDSWGLYHALRWLSGEDDIDAWTPRMKSPRPRAAEGQRTVLIDLAP